MTEFNVEQLIRFVYKDPINKELVKEINTKIESHDIDLMELIIGIETIKIREKFQTSEEHFDWINSIRIKIESKIGYELLSFPVEEKVISKTKKSFIKKLSLVVGIVIIIFSTLFLLNQPLNNNLTRFADNQLQTNELPTLPPKYETVLSTDDRPKELAKAYKDREYEKAITLIKEEQANPENEFIKSELDFILAVCYLRTGKNKKAIGLLKPITLDNSTYSSDAKLELSYAYIKTGDYKKAYDLSIDIKENSSSFYQKEAEETIKEILEFKPGINQN